MTSPQTTETETEDEWRTLYIDGEWRPPNGREMIPVENPATDGLYTEVPAATEDDVDEAYRAAAEAQTEWAERPQEERTEIIESTVDQLKNNRGEVTDLLAMESGKVWLVSAVEMQASIDNMEVSVDLELDESEYPSEIEGKQNVVERKPAGVIGVITPWNFPLYLAMRAIAPALALGNTVVLKPDEFTPVTGGLVIAKLFERAGLPSGVLNVIPGYGEEIGDHFSSHPIPRVISFTGSAEVGQQVGKNAASNFAKPSLELGGNNPHIVTEDANVELAATAGAFASFMHQGQVCISINRHLVHESVYDSYVEQVVEHAEGLEIGDPRDSRNEIGPVINESQRDKIVRFIERSVEAGAQIETGGEYEDLFVEPTVLSGVTNEMPVACNENFGPLAPVIPYENDEEVVEMANDTEYGLSASVHSQDRDRAEWIASRLDTGMVHINDQPMNVGTTVPFGGIKRSGFGRFNGEWIRDEFTVTKWTSYQEEERDYMIF